MSTLLKCSAMFKYELEHQRQNAEVKACGLTFLKADTWSAAEGMASSIMTSTAWQKLFIDTGAEIKT